MMMSKPDDGESESRCSNTSDSSTDLSDWREKRQRLFIYWCFTHFIHGMIHSIRYSSQYLYFKDVMRVSNPDFLYGLSVSFIGVTGVIFPLLISPLIDRSRNIKKAILLVNVFGFFGNLLYALPFTPVLPLLGQLLAGTAPAFGVIAMGEISRCYTPEKITKRVSALSLIYSIGTFTSIGLVFTFLYVDFNIGKWRIDFANMPGLFLTFAFLISTILAPFLVSDVSKEFDLKLEERIKRSSCGSTPNQGSKSSSPSMTPRKMSPNTQEHLNHDNNGKQKNIPKIIRPDERRLTPPNNLHKLSVPGKPSGNHLFNDKEDIINQTDNDGFRFPKFNKDGYAKLSMNDLDFNENQVVEEEEKFKTTKATFRSIWKILRHRLTFLMMVVTFMEAFVYSIIVTSLPVLATKFLGWGKVELALLSMVNKFISVVISGSVYFLADCLPDVLMLVYGTFASMLALLALSLLELVEGNTAATTVMMFVIATLSISGVPLIITSTRAMLAKLVPSEIQSLTEAVRMSVFEASFVPAGFLVPLITMNVSVTAITLLAFTLCVTLLSIYEIRALIHLKEEDLYWQDLQSSE